MPDPFANEPFLQQNMWRKKHFHMKQNYLAHLSNNGRVFRNEEKFSPILGVNLDFAIGTLQIVNIPIKV